MSTVYVVQVPGAGGFRKVTYDTTPAEQYGQIRYIFESGFTPSLNPTKAIEIAKNALAAFNSEKDFIVWAGGDPAGMLIVGAIAYAYSDDEAGSIRFLKWENNRDPVTRQANGLGHYIPVTFPIGAAL